MFWYHFYSAIERERPMSTEKAREQIVNELNLTNLADNEAIHLLKLANEGVYDTSDMPERWHGVLEEMEGNLSRGASIERGGATNKIINWSPNKYPSIGHQSLLPVFVDVTLKRVDDPRQGRLGL